MFRIVSQREKGNLECSVCYIYTYDKIYLNYSLMFNRGRRMLCIFGLTLYRKCQPVSLYHRRLTIYQTISHCLGKGIYGVSCINEPCLKMCGPMAKVLLCYEEYTKDIYSYVTVITRIRIDIRQLSLGRQQCLTSCSSRTLIHLTQGVGSYKSHVQINSYKIN